ncbi:hypothetical protein TNCV_2207661 [Trichonephila clavipes]|uniref:Uncharacterized protein n=1 Tax=Trichonephila clavipes TaxID=2585209 RepID=A0A8X6S637_TRICX|nr:hypothetical protein TNCV_2207661 [Trichonephila clavipes]
MHATNVRSLQYYQKRMRHLDAVNVTWIHPKKRRLTIRASRFVVDHTFENAPVCDAASRVAEAMVSELVIGRGPLRFSTEFRVTVLKPSIPYSANSHWISTDARSKTEIR